PSPALKATSWVPGSTATGCGVRREATGCPSMVTVTAVTALPVSSAAARTRPGISLPIRAAVFLHFCATERPHLLVAHAERSARAGSAAVAANGASRTAVSEAMDSHVREAAAGQWDDPIGQRPSLTTSLNTWLTLIILGDRVTGAFISRAEGTPVAVAVRVSWQ